VLLRCWTPAGPAGPTWSYADLDRAAAGSAGWLRLRCAPGDRVLLPYTPGPQFVANLLACLYAGTVPVPVPAPDGHRDQVDRTAAILLDCRPTAVLTDAATMPALQERLTAAAAGPVACLATDQPADPQIEPCRSSGAPGHQLALLQYTSGSTSDPKGVMVGQDNLVHNLDLMRRSHGWHRNTRFCSWLPGYHDMGLIAMLLAPLYLGGSVVLMPATDFLKRPGSWLDLIDRYDVNVSCAPNFAYELCARRVGPEQVAELDLSRWEQACNGAEPVDALTLARFRQRFAAAGFRAEAFLPGYGLAEATLYVSGAPAVRPPVVRRVNTAALQADRLIPAVGAGTEIGLDDLVGPSPAASDPAGFAGTLLVSSGVVGDDLDVRVVDPQSRRVLADGAVGEIWIRGGSVARGYWNRPDESADTFGARTIDGDGDFLRTGDLGAFSDGQLYVTGRLKELIILNGRNLYPHDVEREVAGIDPAFADLPCCVFSVPGRPEEKLVVVQEVRGRGREAADLQQLSQAVRASLSGRFGVRVSNVVLVRPGRIRRTTSGKLQRGRMRRLFESGELEALHEDLDPHVSRRYRSIPEPVPIGAARTEEPA
jgi:acyl-CoA synthetase (AMP-forming)/AMP-acid ligase II